MPRKLRPELRISADTVTKFDVTDEAFMEVATGVQEEDQSASSAGRTAAGALNEAFDFHSQRGRRSRLLDESFEAKITTDVDKWKSSPDEFDFPGVDTPSGFEF